MICMATYGNGVQINGMATMKGRQKMGVLGLLKKPKSIRIQ
jgi:hypothetical protein